MKKNGNRLGKRKERKLMGLPPSGPSLPLPGPVTQQPGQVLEVRRTEVTTKTEGPIPDPQALAAYEAIKPGFAERIVVMAERQASHRQGLEAQLTQAQINDLQAERTERKRGQYIAGGVVLAALAVAVAVGTIGQGPWAASVIGAVPFGGLVVAFISGRAKSENGKQNARK